MMPSCLLVILLFCIVISIPSGIFSNNLLQSASVFADDDSSSNDDDSSSNDDDSNNDTCDNEKQTSDKAEFDDSNSNNQNVGDESCPGEKDADDEAGNEDNNDSTFDKCSINGDTDIDIVSDAEAKDKNCDSIISKPDLPKESQNDDKAPVSEVPNNSSAEVPAPASGLNITLQQTQPQQFVLPPPVITSPGEGDSIDLDCEQEATSTSVLIQGTSEHGTTAVLIFVDGSFRAGTFPDANGNWQITIDLTEGTHTIHALAQMSSYECQSSSTPLTVIVECPPSEPPNDDDDDGHGNHDDGNGHGSSDITIIDAAGDLDCSNNLHDQVKNDKPDYFVALGDLCYKSNLSDFKETFGDFKKADKLKCVIGENESEKIGNKKIFKEAQKYCGDHWHFKTADNSVLLIGLNTDGDIDVQSQWAQSLVTNGKLMKGVESVMLFIHKPVHTPSGSEHQAENSIVQMYSKIENKLPQGIQVYEISAHNHFMAESDNNRWFISGAGGGEKLDNINSSSQWPFVNDEKEGYLKIKIDEDNGKIISSQFYGIDGKIID